MSLCAWPRPYTRGMGLTVCQVTDMIPALPALPLSPPARASDSTPRGKSLDAISVNLLRKRPIGL